VYPHVNYGACRYPPPQPLSLTLIRSSGLKGLRASFGRRLSTVLARSPMRRSFSSTSRRGNRVDLAGQYVSDLGHVDQFFAVPVDPNHVLAADQIRHRVE